jgi:hypothetical protein
MVRTDADGGSIWLVDTTRPVANRFVAHPSVVAYPVWSPDGETIAFSKADHLGPAAVGSVLPLFRKRLTGGGAEERLTVPATLHLGTDWSRDGRFLLFFDMSPPTMEDIWYLYYVSPDYKLMVVTLYTKADGLQPSVPQELFPLSAEVTMWSPYQAAADGQRLMVRATGEREPPRPLTVIVNWPAWLENKGGGQ